MGAKAMAADQSLKDPWLAVNLSMFFPGLGHLYGGRLLRGLVWMGTEVVMIAIAIWSIFAANGNPLKGLSYLGIAIMLYCFNLVDTLLCVHRDNPSLIAEKIPRIHKNPWFAVFVSRIIPGLGHLYLNKPILGVILLTVSLFLFQLKHVFIPLLVITPLVTAIAVYHSFLMFPRRQSVLSRRVVAVMAGVIFIGGLLVNFAPQWLEQRLELFVIPSDSMVPTLHIGDRIFVNPLDHEPLRRGDIVVFEPNQAIKSLDPQVGEFYIKRIIALPGETVQVHSGLVWINEQPLQENYIAAPPAYEMRPHTVPSGSYFVMGDNRNNSFDSHIWGWLQQPNILGRAYKVFWPPQHIQSLRQLPSNHLE
jgi:signal peptidase I